jgi:hypothetical protein
MLPGYRKLAEYGMSILMTRSAFSKDHVKGLLKVMRLFGASFLKYFHGHRKIVHFFLSIA